MSRKIPAKMQLAITPYYQEFIGWTRTRDRADKRRRCGGTTIKPRGCDSARASVSKFSTGSADQPVGPGCKRAGRKWVTPGRTCTGVASVAVWSTGRAGRWLSMARNAGHTKTSKPTKAAHGDPGRPTMRVSPHQATVTLRPGLVATP